MDRQRHSGERQRRTTVVHLTASPCFGGIERQILELSRELQDSCRSIMVSFPEEGRCQQFIEQASHAGHAAYALEHDFPRFVATYRELQILVNRVQADVLCCHGYKANLFGLLVARRLRIPILSVSHGWTAESRRVRLFEAVDRRVLRWMDQVICVSAGQANKVCLGGVPESLVRVIRDAVRCERFVELRAGRRSELERMFSTKPNLIIGAAGRLSPEKGFRHLVDAAPSVLRDFPSAGFVLFGEGALHNELSRQIKALGLQERFRLAGFCSNLDSYYPHFDVLALPSYTEGLPNVVLEACAAGVPVVATAVGGTPEVLRDGRNGYLVKPGDAAALAKRISDVLRDHSRRQEMGNWGRELVREQFSFAGQAQEYRALLNSLTASRVTTRQLSEEHQVGAYSHH